MKIGMTTFGADGGRSGLGRYVRSLLDEFPDLLRGDELEIITDVEGSQLYSPKMPGQYKVLVRPDAPSGAAGNIIWHEAILPRLCAERGFDVLFLPNGNRRLSSRVPCPTVATLHDFAIRHVPGKYGLIRQMYLNSVLPWQARRLSRVIAVSSNSRADIVEHCGVPPELIHVIHNGVALDRFRPERPGVQQTPPYFLYVSRIEHPGKNHVRLIEAFGRFKSETGLPHRLVIAGADWLGAKRVHEVARSSRHSESIHFTGFVDDSDLPSLYSGACAFILPSLFEGFGIPVIEAMASGIPVALSNVSALPEVGGDAAVYFDPTSAGEIAERMHLLVRDSDLTRVLVSRGFMRARRFTWRRSAKRTLRVLRMVGAA